jgi:hypothetical protein
VSGRERPERALRSERVDGVERERRNTNRAVVARDEDVVERPVGVSLQEPQVW